MAAGLSYGISYFLGSETLSGMAHPHVADGEEGIQVWRIDANILNKHSRIAHKVWSLLGIWAGANNSSQKKKPARCECCTGPQA
jgi:hypothetical protein